MIDSSEKQEPLTIEFSYNLTVPLLEKKRGILIELSYTGDPANEDSVMKMLLPSFEDQVKQLGPVVVVGAKTDYEDFYHGNNNSESSFFIQLSRWWALKEEILNYLNDGVNVVLKSYMLDMFAFFYANNCFKCNTGRDPVALNSFYSKVQGLPMPDVIIFFKETPQRLEERYIKMLKERNMEPSEDEVSRCVIFSKLFRREQTKMSFLNYFEVVREVTFDRLHLSVTIPGIVIAKKAFHSHDPLRFY